MGWDVASVRLRTGRFGFGVIKKVGRGKVWVGKVGSWSGKYLMQTFYACDYGQDISLLERFE